MVNVVIGTGRMNPPTKGHWILINELLETAHKFNVKAEFFIVDGEKSSLDKDKNPLTADQRIEILRKWFPEVRFDIVGSAFELFDVLEVQNKIPLAFIAGSDRVENYTKLVAYRELKTPVIGIDRETVGEDISATKAREAAKAKDWNMFVSLMPSQVDIKYHERVYMDLVKLYDNGHVQL